MRRAPPAPERDLRRRRQEAGGFRRRRERATRPPSASVSGCSCASRAAPGRRLREAADGFDDPIEFEGPQGAGVHGLNSDELRQG